MFGSCCPGTRDVNLAHELEKIAVHLGGGDDLEWVERREGRELVHQAEPGTSAWQRFQVWFLSLLPIDWLL